MYRSLLIAASLALPSAAQALPGFQDTVALDRAVAAFTGKGVGEEGGARAPVDVRLRLAQCPTVALAWRADNHDSVVVTCTGPEWRLFVPIRSPAAIAVPAGAVTVAPGAAPVARAAPVIRRGDAVTITAGDDSFSITRDGIAMADAAPGERVALRVDGARAPVQGVALAAGRVELTNWQQ